MLQERQQSVPLAAGECPSLLHPNADGVGYYRFSMEESWWRGLIDGLSTMPPAEALAAADSLDAGFRAGRVSANTYVDGMAALVDHETWDVVEAGLGSLESMREILTTDEAAPVEAALSTLARPRFQRLGDESGDAVELLNARIQRFLALVARDRAVRAPMVERAVQRIGLDGNAPDPASVPESELETVLSVGVQDLGAPFFERLLERAMASEDRAFRYRAFGALARTEDPALAARLQQVILSGQLQGYEPLGILSRQMARAATIDLTYAWLRENVDSIMQVVPDMFRSQYVPGLGAGFCSVERAAQWSAFIESQADELPGFERSLAQAVESIRLCAALREAAAPGFIAAVTESD